MPELLRLIRVEYAGMPALRTDTPWPSSRKKKLPTQDISKHLPPLLAVGSAELNSVRSTGL
jgi:hypothetical protein